MQVRRATMREVIEMQHCNLRCLPENYNLRYYYYHYLSWPQELHVLEDVNGQVAGYVLAKLDDEDDLKKKHGHVTSLAVLRTHRKLGAASTLMRAAMQQMYETDDANFCSLHVRKTNAAALHLYQDSLKFRCVEVDEKYYVDDEDAYHMKRFFKLPSAEKSTTGGGSGGGVKVAYITPQSELKWTRLDQEMLQQINADMPGFKVVTNQQQQDEQKSTTTGSSPAAASGATTTDNSGKATTKAAAGANNNNSKKKGGNNTATDADIEAQLAALGEGSGKKSKDTKQEGGKEKEKEGGKKNKK
jgi:ribosomal protein S18 acetylase RimI-like enzyme